MFTSLDSAQAASARVRTARGTGFRIFASKTHSKGVGSRVGVTTPGTYQMNSKAESTMASYSGLEVKERVGMAYLLAGLKVLLRWQACVAVAVMICDLLRGG